MSNVKHCGVDCLHCKDDEGSCMKKDKRGIRNEQT